MVYILDNNCVRQEASLAVSPFDAKIKTSFNCTDFPNSCQHFPHTVRRNLVFEIEIVEQPKTRKMVSFDNSKDERNIVHLPDNIVNATTSNCTIPWVVQVSKNLFLFLAKFKCRESFGKYYSSNMGKSATTKKLFFEVLLAKGNFSIGPHYNSCMTWTAFWFLETRFVCWVYYKKYIYKDEMYEIYFFKFCVYFIFICLLFCFVTCLIIYWCTSLLANS